MPPINPSGALPLLVIPGVDPSAPLNSQIDQIDQQITFMLQDIDANFARIHHVITERIIPALKRFDRDTQPVKEASKFWRSFFEAAAQIQVAASDQSLLSGAQTYTDQETAQETISAPDGTRTVETDSFLGPAVSSTPLPGTALSSHHISSDISRGGKSLSRSPEEESWAASVESPFTKLDRQLRDDLRLDHENHPVQPYAQNAAMLSGYSSILSSDTDTPQHSPMHTNYPPSTVGSSTAGTIQPPAEPTVRTGASALQSAFAAPTDKEKGKQKAERPALTDRTNGALLKNVLLTNAQKTPRAALNPFRPAEEQGKRWNGIADLRVPSPAKGHKHRTPKRGMPSLNLPIDDDSDDDDLPPGMSPPVTMNFTLPAKKLARTPAKEVARLAVEGMTKGLGGDTPSPELEERNSYGWEDQSAAHPTPPRRRPTASPAKVRASLAAGGSRLSALHPRVSDILQDGNVSFTSDDSSFDDFGSPPTQHLNYGGAAQHEDTFDSEGDSFSSVGSAPPGALAPMLGGRDVSVDDSFSSEDSFAPPRDARVSLARPSAGGEEEETVFGVGKEDGGLGRPAQRRVTGFELLGRDQDDMTVHGGRVEDAAVGESPTPWPRER
ncbi:hypothetical protein CALVIDRAFT_563569 [Calocera viscosa TUFC12733]|uniref:DASH complex subunit ASK1 n=1 Tax=Calocera viscosa (strain TUFC12733) TaxID=1330018 RepID=A0A167MPK2_CALVF|nr:hypothetical protein CALVIDRAFT_563569 [Calocera viscosa TUFC12733]